MDIVFDIIFELIVDGSVEAVGNKQVPMAVRVIAAIILLAFFGGIIGFCIFLGIHDRNWITLVLGALIMIVTIYQIIRLYNRYKHRSDE